MSDEILTDNQGNPVYLSEVMNSWIDTRQAAYRMNVTSPSLHQRIRNKSVRAVQINRNWYIDPNNIKGYKPGKHRKPPKG